MLIDPNSPQDARAVLERLLPDPSSRREILNFFAGAIQQAHALVPAGWSVTLDLNKKFARLNVGSIETLAIFRNSVHFVLIRDTRLPALERIPGFRWDPDALNGYDKVPGSVVFNIPSAQFAAARPLVTESHQELVRRASKTTDNKARFRASHSPGVLQYLMDTINPKLENPTYCTSRQAIVEPISTTAFVMLSWRDVDVRDVLPLEWFEGDLQLEGVVHEMRGPRGGTSGKAMCDVEKGGLVAKLDYRKYKSFNNRSGALSGIARLTFTDADRTKLVRFEWQDERDKAFSEGARFECEYKLPPAPPYTMPTVPAPKVEQMVRPRPGQALFRTSMHLAYDQRCCVTGSSVAEALEAAHIDDYRAPDSNNARNGLLLRRDIHALFDAHLIAIEPGSHMVHVAPSARGSGGYAEWHGRKITLPVEKSHHPDPAALKRRWANFTASAPVS